MLFGTVVFRLFSALVQSPQVRLIAAHKTPIEGERPVEWENCLTSDTTLESGCLGMQPKAGGKLHPRLNTSTSLIANKYREGKLKRTLKREFKST
jgi:hypothetical protein